MCVSADREPLPSYLDLFERNDTKSASRVRFGSSGLSSVCVCVFRHRQIIERSRLDTAAQDYIAEDERGMDLDFIKTNTVVAFFVYYMV